MKPRMTRIVGCLKPRKTRKTRIIGCLFVVALAASAPVASAQSQASPPARVQMQIGPLTLRPRLDLRDVGVDSNVFNEAGEPREDFTATISPRLDADLDLSWARARYSSVVDLVYFQKLQDERSVNRGTEGRFELILDRFRPYVGGSITDTRDRLNAELDARAHRRQTMLSAGAMLALTTRTTVILTVRRESLEFDADEIFRGVRLAETLNNQTTIYEGGLRFSLTPLTTLQVLAAEERDRFDGATARDARTIRITPTLEFDPRALVSGRLSVGYTHLAPENPSLAPFRGLTVLGNLAYTVSSTRLETVIERDVQYSYEAFQPYYLTTGGRVTLTQVIAGPVDVQGVVGRQRLAYRAFGAAADGGTARTDTVTTWGGGVGYRLGGTARIGVNFDQAARRSPAPERVFDRQRIFGSLTYGF